LNDLFIGFTLSFSLLKQPPLIFYFLPGISAFRAGKLVCKSLDLTGVPVRYKKISDLEK
jgi:hypothetical protein